MGVMFSSNFAENPKTSRFFVALIVFAKLIQCFIDI